MVRLLERGSASRIAIIEKLLSNPTGLTEDEIMELTGRSRTTVRNTLQRLLSLGLAGKRRRKRMDGRRGPGPIEYWLTTGASSAKEIEAALRSSRVVAEEEVEPAPKVQTTPSLETTHLSRLHVLVKRGTNDAVLTKDGRLLRIEPEALEEVLAHYRKVIRSGEIVAIPLDEFYRRFYPEYPSGYPERPPK